jgi:hypothetical protein
MKKLIGILIFVIGLFFKFQHYPGASLLLIVGCLVSLIITIVDLVSSRKEWKLLLSNSLILLTFLFKIQYWNYSQYVFLLAVLVGSICLTSLFVNKELSRKTTILSLLLFGVLISSWSIRSHHIYYATSAILKEEPNRPEFASAWHKYSWFLNLAGEKAEALNANQNAIDCLSERDQNGVDYKFFGVFPPLTKELLKENRTKIESDTWEKYP